MGAGLGGARRVQKDGDVEWFLKAERHSLLLPWPKPLFIATMAMLMDLAADFLFAFVCKQKETYVSWTFCCFHKTLFKEVCSSKQPNGLNVRLAQLSR
jgi:hypothetical protein